MTGNGSSFCLVHGLAQQAHEFGKVFNIRRHAKILSSRHQADAAKMRGAVDFHFADVLEPRSFDGAIGDDQFVSRDAYVVPQGLKAHAEWIQRDECEKGPREDHENTVSPGRGSRRSIGRRAAISTVLRRDRWFVQIGI